MLKNRHFTLLLLSFLFFIFILTYICFQAFAAEKQVAIHIFNPFPIHLQLEVKCDYDSTLKRYTYYKIVNVNADSNFVLLVPVNLQKCEVWPLKVNYFKPFTDSKTSPFRGLLK